MDTDMAMDTDMVKVTMFMATAQLHQAMARQRKLSKKVYKEENMAIICFAPEKKTTFVDSGEKKGKRLHIDYSCFLVIYKYIYCLHPP